LGIGRTGSGIDSAERVCRSFFEPPRVPLASSWSPANPFPRRAVQNNTKKGRMMADNTKTIPKLAV
jgi:hypothetical protein